MEINETDTYCRTTQLPGEDAGYDPAVLQTKSYKLTDTDPKYSP